LSIPPIMRVSLHSLSLIALAVTMLAYFSTRGANAAGGTAVDPGTVAIGNLGFIFPFNTATPNVLGICGFVGKEAVVVGWGVTKLLWYVRVDPSTLPTTATPSNAQGAWKSVSTGSFEGPPSCLPYAAGYMMLLVRGPDPYPLLLTDYDENKGSWRADAVPLGGVIQWQPSCVSRIAGAVDCFALNNGAVQRRSFDKTGPVDWKSCPASPLASDPHCVAVSTDSIQCYGRRSDGVLMGIDLPGDPRGDCTGTWTAYPGDVITDEPTALLTTNGKVEIHGRNKNGNLVRRTRTGTTMGDWVATTLNITDRTAPYFPTPDGNVAIVTVDAGAPIYRAFPPL